MKRISTFTADLQFNRDHIVKSKWHLADLIHRCAFSHCHIGTLSNEAFDIHFEGVPKTWEFVCPWYGLSLLVLNEHQPRYADFRGGLILSKTESDSFFFDPPSDILSNNLPGHV